MSVATSGGGLSTLAAGQIGPQGIAFGPAGLFWTNYDGGTVMHMGSTSPPLPQPIALASGLLHPLNIALGAATVYWATNSTIMSGY